MARQDHYAPEVRPASASDIELGIEQTRVPLNRHGASDEREPRAKALRKRAQETRPTLGSGTGTGPAPLVYPAVFYDERSREQALLISGAPT